MAPVIVCKQLRKHFFSATSVADMLRFRLRGRRIDALSGCDLAVEQGEVLGILGPNGAGKSTLLRLVAGLLIPDGGELEVLGRGAQAFDASFRGQVCYLLSEERSFSWRISGRENLRFFAALHGLSGAAALGRVSEVLEKVGLGDDADRSVREYSTGMRQRLALARGLLGDPQVFLFDEPTRGVDPARARGLRRGIRDLAEAGRTVLVATHDLQEVQDLCDRVVLLEGGKSCGAGEAGDAASLLGVR